MKQNPKADFVLQPTDRGADVIYIQVKNENGVHSLTIFNRDRDATIINKQKVKVSYYDKDSASITWDFADASGSSISLQADPKVITLKKRVNPGNGHLSFIYVLYMEDSITAFKANF